MYTVKIGQIREKANFNRNFGNAMAYSAQRDTFTRTVFLMIIYILNCFGAQILFHISLRQWLFTEGF